MVFPTTTSGVASAAAACVMASALVACAAPADAAPDAVSSVRVVVDLVRGSNDATLIATEATRVAGVPVSYAASISATRHALFVQCAGADRCDAALARMRAAGTTYKAVEIDGRKTRSAS